MECSLSESPHLYIPGFTPWSVVPMHDSTGSCDPDLGMRKLKILVAGRNNDGVDIAIAKIGPGAGKPGPLCVFTEWALLCRDGSPTSFTRAITPSCF